ncbi:MAG: hypothetical protein QOE56_997 [Solirubrobacterales bacterium]|jgi:hypothetical protein|nr:hypothetical protein [Solirubrobacterales bacterium]
MKTRSTAFCLVLALGLTALAASAGAAMVGVYRNGMDSTAQRAQLIKLAGASCARGGGASALRIAVGKKTESCSYRTPVLGRDLEIAATERLLSGTPTALQRRAYLALELRAGGGAKYQMLVYPLQRKVQLVKVTPEATKYLAIVKNQAAVSGVNKANALRLRAVNLTTGPERGGAKILAFLGATKVAEATDEAAGELTGRASAVSVGAGKNAEGLIASIDDVVIRVPSPF